MEFRRRLLGYSPIAVARLLHDAQTAQAERLTKLRDQLTTVRSENGALFSQIMDAQARISQILAHSRELSGRAVEHLNASGEPLLSFRERNARIETAMQSELDRVRGVLQQLSEVQSRFGADIDGVMNRYRDMAQSLRMELPSGLPTPEKAAPAPDPLTLAKKSFLP